MNIREIYIPSSDGIHSLRTKIYEPDIKPVGILQIVHGMTEHIDRYDAFMTDMAKQGFVTFGADNLGHKKSVRDDSELGFIASKNGWELLCRDVGAVSERIKSEYPALPYYLLGHSMGSFIVRVACAEYVFPDKLVIMGTGGPNPLADVGIGLIKILKAVKGARAVSPFIDKMAFGSYNDRFKGDGERGWLTTNVEIRDKYDNDKYCTFKFTLSAMQDLLTLCKKSNTDACFKSTAKNFSQIFIVSGSEDPVGNYSKGIKEVYDTFKKHSENISMKLYSGYRHEILNDFCYAEVLSDICNFLHGVK